MAAEQNIQIVWEKKEVTHWDLIGSPGACETGDDEYPVKCGEI